MAGPKASLPAPIDRPLSRAYLRQFQGWSNEYPPGLSNPASFRVCENVLVSRDGAVKIRPGLRYLSFRDDPETEEPPLIPLQQGMFMVGTHEVFFIQDEEPAIPPEGGDPGMPVVRLPAVKAYLFAAYVPVEIDLTPDFHGPAVYFFVARYTSDAVTPFEVVSVSTVFDMPPDVQDITFTDECTYVKYLQIDNKIVALSNNGETAVLFYVGADKRAVRPKALPGAPDDYVITFPPDEAWILGPQTDSSTTMQPTATANTLQSSTDADNIHGFLFWYTYSNEFGESEPSKSRPLMLQRGITSWKQETPNAATEPSGAQTNDPTKSADQIFLYPRETEYDANLLEGATHINFYMATYAEGDPQPLESVLVARKELTGTYIVDGWATVTPGTPLYTRTAPMPNAVNRRNWSQPPTAGQGLVAADRLILVNDPHEPAVIKWTSNTQGEYINLTGYVGGGYKTLTSGNLFIASACKLWQNPQSVDSLTILCDGVDGMSTGYYMAPAEITSQSESTSIMGFEETTATPGTTSPYGCEVFNNALIHPIDEQLMKSTAANYAIRHKSLTDLVATSWQNLVDKDKIISAEHDGRIYYIVHNPDGETLDDYCNGNEVWVIDAQVETPNWSRWLVQGVALRKVEIEGQVMMSVVKPDGIYCFDPNKFEDDIIVEDEATADLMILETRPIPWQWETNTQGANRAHDAWCRLQQLTMTFGNFRGHLEWGIRGEDINGKGYLNKKTTQDAAASDVLPWNRDDHLQVRRDGKEWYLFARSIVDPEAVDGRHRFSQGQINLVQYRYTPASVNVGYEYGSVETFEYGRDVALGNDQGHTTDGVPVPYVDQGRYNPTTAGPPL